MPKPLLRRLPPDDYVSRYLIHGFDHLIVLGTYDEHGPKNARLNGWVVGDERFTPGLDRWQRWQVISFDRLEDVRNWVEAGGPDLWDPEKRKIDKAWRPIPEGWSPDEHRGIWRKRNKVKPIHVSTTPPIADRPIRTPDLRGKRFAVCPGYTRSSGGQRHYINFGALTWLYGVNPSECVEITKQEQEDREPKAYEHLIWLYPKRRYEEYLEMREELARGDDAFKLVEP